jgi:hypothetical protein
MIHGHLSYTQFSTTLTDTTAPPCSAPFTLWLREATGAWKEGGGKHPKIVLPSGRRIPVPAHTDLARGTVRSILRAAGVDMPLEKFMSAKAYSRSHSN